MANQYQTFSFTPVNARYIRIVGHGSSAPSLWNSIVETDVNGFALDLPVPPAQYCGDGHCNNGETCSTCAGDCGNCPPGGDDFIIYGLWDFENSQGGTYTPAMAQEDFSVRSTSAMHGSDSQIANDVINGVSTKVFQGIQPSDDPNAEYGYRGTAITCYTDDNHTAYQELYMSYNIKFGPYLSNIEGKMPGLRGWPDVGYDMTPTMGFYYCPMFQETKIITYHYDHTPDQIGTNDFCCNGYFPWGCEGYVFNQIYFEENVWYTVTQRVVVNSFTGATGNANGINEIWINGRLVHQENYIRAIEQIGASNGIDGFNVAAFTTGTIPSQTTYINIDNVVLWINPSDPTYGTRNLHSGSATLSIPI